MERLQKLLAQAGIASRRHAEEMILAGRVRVNGKVVDTLGAQADPANDTIMVDNQPVAVESKVYYILNKPRGYISDRDDTSDYKTALDLVPDGRRLFAAGRLDMMSEGMLFLTNDGELANRLTHPRYEHEKEYLVLVFGTPDAKVMERLVKGIMFDGEWMRADSAERAGKQQEFGEAGRDETWLRIILHEGKKRQIRHMCASLGHPVKRLIRVRIGPLKLGTTKVGEWRKLSPDELTLLRKNAQPRPRPRTPHPPKRTPREPSSFSRSAQNPSGESKPAARPSTRPARSPQDAPRAERSRSRAERPTKGTLKSKGRTERPSRDTFKPKGRSERTSGDTFKSKGRSERPARDAFKPQGRDERPSRDVNSPKARDERPTRGAFKPKGRAPFDNRKAGRPTQDAPKTFGRARAERHGAQSSTAKSRDGGREQTPGRVGRRSAQRNNRSPKPDTRPDANKSNFRKRKS